ncbi:MAG TPA: NAD(P)-dependent oxidoreductase [Desulfobacterales bacterium]|nr:NAD(P)-dependent oxidoreductase [Desulfobacterales bacterium]
MNNENKELPGILVTGASGFIGRHFVIAVSDKFRLFCVARRSQKEVSVPFKDTIHWLQADISKWDNLLKIYEYINKHGGVDYVLHLAGYYDFTLKKNPVYEQVNVIATRHLLELSNMMQIKRFIFSSSIAACKFPHPGEALSEESPADGDFPYACSKRRGELLIKEYSESFPCSIVRLAAVYSDWCEYPMLYMLLRHWLSGNKLTSRILSGRGESAIPYIHIRDLIKLFLRIIEISDTLPQFATYIAGPKESISHEELFKAVTRYYYGYDVKPFKMPKFFIRLGLIVLSFSGWLTGKETLEKPWMAGYIDKKLTIDPSVTYTALGWKPAPRYLVLRRLLFLTEKITSHPYDWNFRNEITIHKVAYRKSTIIYDILIQHRDLLIDMILREVTLAENRVRFPNYSKMDRELLKWYIILNYQLIATTVRDRDRTIIPSAVQQIAHRRYIEGFKVKEVKDLILITAKTMETFLLQRPELKSFKQRVEDYIVLTAQYAADELEDNYDVLKGILGAPLPTQIFSIKENEKLTKSKNIKLIVEQLEDIGANLLSYYPEGEIIFKKYGVLIKLRPPNN